MALEFRFLLEMAQEKMSEKQFHVLCQNKPEHHAPIYHQYGVLGHAYAVWTVGQELSQETGLDLTDMTLLHDSGKMQQFKTALWEFHNKDGQIRTAFLNHEAISAKISEVQGLSAEVCTAIRFHHYAYRGVGMEKLLKAVNPDRRTLELWLLLCACDAAGKLEPGHPKGQREMIANNFLAIARAAGMEESDRVLQVAIKTTLEHPVPQVPDRFSL